MNIKIEIITIGNEILEGRILNTNAQYACKKLYESGYLVESECSVLDDHKTLQEKLENGLKHFDVVICSGGLGPTQDDITLGVAAKVFNSDFYLDKALLTKLKKRYKTILDLAIIEPCAKVPKKAEIFKDHLGMAPGYIFKKGKKRLILLPGVPHEFTHLMSKEVIPYLEKHYPHKTHEYKKVIHLCRIAESNIVPVLDELLKKYPKVNFGVYPDFGILAIHIKTHAKTQKEANSILTPCLKEFKIRFPKQWFDGSFQNISEAIQHYMLENNFTLSLAESCTGGALSAVITANAGASQFFKGSIVSYNNEIKHQVLEVTASTLKQEGAVSQACISEMALGAQKLFNTDFAFATSGVAGPDGGTTQNPIGSVWIAIAYRNQIIFTQHLQLPGDRSIIIKRTVNYLLAEFWINKDNI